MSRSEWLRELEAERVTSSRESLSDVLARLDLERPESPRQLHLRGRLEWEARERRRARDAGADWDAARSFRYVDRWGVAA
jgi:hypothetical protein